MKRFLIACLVTCALLGFGHTAHAYTLPKAKLIAVYFYADWCPNCKLLSPEFDQARKDDNLDARDILFVKMNLTDANSIHQSILLAQGLGIAPYVQQQGSSTGYVALLAADTKQEIARFDRTSKAADIDAGIDKALGAPAPRP